VGHTGIQSLGRLIYISHRIILPIWLGGFAAEINKSLIIFIYEVNFEIDSAE
jgi:hypothetical protein